MYCGVLDDVAAVRTERVLPEKIVCRARVFGSPRRLVYWQITCIKFGTFKIPEGGALAPLS